jgi:heterodisulfide reductase subunit C
MADTEKTEIILIEETDPGFCDEVASLPGGENIRKCLACGTCAAGCPVTNIYEEYNSRSIIRKVMLGLREEVLSSPLIWFCVMCYRCYSRCPQQVNFTDIMRVLRYLSIKYSYASPEMLKKSDDCDELAQMARLDMIKESIEGKKKVMEELRSKLNRPQKESGV